MQIFFMILLIILSVSLIITVTLQPRQIQIFRVMPRVILVGPVTGQAKLF